MHSDLCLRLILALYTFVISANSLGSSSSKASSVSETFFRHNEALRVSTDARIYAKLVEEHAGSHVTIVPVYNANLLAFAATGQATKTELTNASFPNHYGWRSYEPPARRIDGDNGSLTDIVRFGIYEYYWQGEPFIIYIVYGQDGQYGETENQYIISSSQSAVDALILKAGQYTTTLHDETWVFDSGYWQKDAGLWRAARDASWSDVILSETMKTSIQSDVSRFFNSREVYKNLNVPWKRGVIFHGPPGNGKTVSIKAIMHDLYNATAAVPTLYVRTLASIGGREYALMRIFAHARAQAPCLLIFEDLDSVITSSVRSYFLNQVDGLQMNDGIMMIGSTNHLELLDPGIAKRPSRFDRKYLFPNPNMGERKAYAEFWRKKIEKQKGKTGVEFPKILLEPIANITEGFSFAYIQEAFVGALLEIAREDGDQDQDLEVKVSVLTEDKELDDYQLWRVFKKQVIALRKELEDESNVRVISPDVEVDNTISGGLPHHFEDDMLHQQHLLVNAMKRDPRRPY